MADSQGGCYATPRASFSVVSHFQKVDSPQARSDLKLKDWVPLTVECFRAVLGAMSSFAPARGWYLIRAVENISLFLAQDSEIVQGCHLKRQQVGRRSTLELLVRRRISQERSRAVDDTCLAERDPCALGNRWSLASIGRRPLAPTLGTPFIGGMGAVEAEAAALPLPGLKAG